MSCHSVVRRPAHCRWRRGPGEQGYGRRPPSSHLAASRWSRQACCSGAGHSDSKNMQTNAGLWMFWCEILLHNFPSFVKTETGFAWGSVNNLSSSEHFWTAIPEPYQFREFCSYLLSQHFKFVRPGLDVGQSVTDLSGLFSHTSGPVPDRGQSAVSQLLDLDVQRCQVGASLQLRCWVTAGEQRRTWDSIGTIGMIVK